MTEHEETMQMTATETAEEGDPEFGETETAESQQPEPSIEASAGEAAEDASGDPDSAVDADVPEDLTGAPVAVDADVPEDVTAAPVNENFKWYVVHTYSGYENRAKASLEESIRREGMEEFFGEILIPTENVMELGKGGQKKTSKRKFFPGYMLVQLELNDQSWHIVKGTPKITGFVGNATKPPSIPEHEVRKLTQQIDEGTLKPKPRVQFEEGEDVRVIDGPFANFNGTVDAVNEDKGKVRVLVSIFGRATPVELDFIQVEKVG